jgi:hypothetical protein
MAKSNRYVFNLISRIVKEELDKALIASNKRRKEFKGAFSKVFLEAEAPTQASAAPPTPETPPAPPQGAGSAAPDATAGPPTGTPGEAPETNPDGSPASPDMGGEEGEADVDASGGGGGFGGFGGGGGGGGGGAGEEQSEGEAEEDSSDSEESDQPQGDPIASMVSTAQELLNQTNDPNLIVKSLKGQIQTVFAEPEHALGLVKALYDTQDSILQSVAQRLYLFIKTARP